MFNSGGAVQQFDVINSPSNTDDATNNGPEGTATLVIKLRGCGCLGAYSSQKPIRCTLDASEVMFDYDTTTGLMTVEIPVPEKEMYKWTLEILLWCE
jgi:raffinose synthase